MSQPLARLRKSLDFMPSPAPEHPGLLIRDPYRFSDAVLVIPPVLIEVLECFDGQQTELDLRKALVEATGQLEVSRIAKDLTGALSEAGFLEDEHFARLEEERRREFFEQDVRAAAHAGSAYPEDPGVLQAAFDGYFRNARGPEPIADVAAIAAPHVSPEGGWRSYSAAFAALPPTHRDRTFVILATSHYGTPEKFGVTRKDFATPYGNARTDTRLAAWLAERGGGAVEQEDFCFSFEHTVEFQVVFLQHLFGPEVRILPVLCGPFANSLYYGGKPEDNEGVRRFFDALGELHDREGGRLCWVLGVDMAHMGARYGDQYAASADQGVMAGVRARDRQRIERINAGDAAGFWDLVQENRDDLKWCGSAPFYTFLKACPKLRGELLHYEQWNIDPQSVVSFAGIGFREAGQ